MAADLAKHTTASNGLWIFAKDPEISVGVMYCGAVFCGNFLFNLRKILLNRRHCESCFAFICV